MLLYFNTNNSKHLNSHIFFITIMKYIFIIASLKFIEHKNTMNGFFNIYIGLIIVFDIGFTLYNYIKVNLLNNVSVKTNNLSLTTKNDFNIYPDEIINTNFNIDDFNEELEKFNNKIKEITKKNKTIRIIKKNNITESEIKKFNEDVLNKN